MIAPVVEFDAKAFAKKERARRELARRKVANFADYIDVGSKGKYLAPHLRLIGDYIDRAIDDTLWDDVPGDGVKILIISAPPRHWKSSLGSQKAPAYFIAKRASEEKPHSVILTSYGATLAEKSSRMALETVRDNPELKKLFPNIRISKTSQSMQEWSLEGSAYPACIAAGVGGGLTGQGADMLVIDDPIKDSQQANSPAYRDMLWEWWAEVARTRVNPGGFVIILMTRWHIDDLVGRLMEQIKKGKGERIVHLRLPALAETDEARQTAGQMGLPVDANDPLGRGEGEALWAEQYPASQLEATQRKFPKTFDALYQGRPIPAGGFVVSRDRFKIIPQMPKENTTWVWGTDWAITAKEIAGKRDPDYTAGALVGLHLVNGNPEDARLVICFITRGQHNQNEARQMVKDALVGSECKRVFAGQDNIDRLMFENMRADSALLNYQFFVLERNEFSGDKMTRAGGWLQMVQAGRVDLVSGPWITEFLDEVEMFPNGAHDDQVDAVSVAAAALGTKSEMDNAVEYMASLWD